MSLKSYNGFQVGDIIRWRSSPDHHKWKWEILNLREDGFVNVKCIACPIDRPNDLGLISNGSLKIGGPELVKKANNNKEKTMANVSKMGKSILDADTQALIKAGFMCDNLELTYEGQAALSALTFAANKDALIAMAKAKIEEETKK